MISLYRGVQLEQQLLDARRLADDCDDNIVSCCSHVYVSRQPLLDVRLTYQKENPILAIKRLALQVQRYLYISC